MVTISCDLNIDRDHIGLFTLSVMDLSVMHRHIYELHIHTCFVGRLSVIFRLSAISPSVGEVILLYMAGLEQCRAFERHLTT